MSPNSENDKRTWEDYISNFNSLSINFRNNKNKIQYLYLLTPKGISEKTKLTINFLKKRAEEYNKLKQEMKSDG